MIDWNLALRIAGGGFASVFLTLMTLAATVWIIGLVLQLVARKTAKSSAESLGTSKPASTEQPQSRNYSENDLKALTRKSYTEKHN